MPKEWVSEETTNTSHQFARRCTVNQIGTGAVACWSGESKEPRERRDRTYCIAIGAAKKRGHCVKSTSARWNRPTGKISTSRYLETVTARHIGGVWINQRKRVLSASVGWNWSNEEGDWAESCLQSELNAIRLAERRGMKGLMMALRCKDDVNPISMSPWVKTLV
jgi:hypothetical protein